MAGTVSVMDFGAVGDGTTDDTAAFNSAIAYANAVLPIGESANNGGLGIIVPNGRYVISAALDPIIRGGVFFVGESAGGSILLPSHDGNIFRWENLLSPIAYLIIGGGLSGLKIEYLTTPGTNACVAELLNANNIAFTDIYLESVGRLAKLGNASKNATGVTFDNIRGTLANIGVPVIEARNGAGLFLSSTCHMSVAGVGNPVVNRVSTMTTASGRSLINLGELTWDTCVVDGLYERFWRGLNVIALPSAVIQNIWIKPGTIFDYFSDDPVHLNALSGGVISCVQGANFWVASWSGSGVRVQGPGAILDVDMQGVISPFAGEYGFLCTAPAARRVSVVGCKFNASNRLNVFASGIVFIGGDEIVVERNSSGINGSSGGLPWQAFDGIHIGADIANFSITDNDSGGTHAAYAFADNTTASVNRRANNNRHADYAGRKSTGVYVIPATNVPWENKSAFDVQVTVGGGSVSGIAINGTTTGMTSGAFLLKPADTITLTYSSAPTTLFYVQP